MAIYLVNGEFTATLSEAAGFKTGIALSKEQLIDIFPSDSDYKEMLSMSDESVIRIHSEDVDYIFNQILYYLGNIESPDNISSTIRLLHKYMKNEKLYPIFMAIFDMFNRHHKLMLDEAIKNGTKVMNPEPFMRECAEKYGKVGLNMAFEFIKGNSEDMHCRLSTYRRFEWDDTIDLKELFLSESLDSKYGEFIDQRYINFLHRNENKLGDMHWRKFEGLTAEYFDRQGYKVELGPGRNDGGIDVRVWKDKSGPGEAPLILIQCKRYQNKIDRTVVKALWADVQWEKAQSGLIVTTSSLSPGAANDCIARGYNIEQADKKIITTWLDSMKTPGTGVFMGK